MIAVFCTFCDYILVMEMKVTFAFTVLVAVLNDYANAAASGKNRSIQQAKITSFPFKLTSIKAYRWLR